MPATTGNLKLDKLWKSHFTASSRNSSNIRTLHDTDLFLALSKPLDVIEFYHKLVAATKPSEIDMIPFTQFVPVCALLPMNCYANIVVEMNYALALALHLDQTGKLNLDDETINILYQKHSIDSTSGIHAFDFIHALLKKSKQQLNERMPMPLDIEQATSIGSFGANL
jgi:hypothetical protein